MNVKHGTKLLLIREKQSIEKIQAQYVCSEMVADLRNELVILSSSSDMKEWEVVGLEVQKFLYFSECPRVIPLTRQ